MSGRDYFSQTDSGAIFINVKPQPHHGVLYLQEAYYYLTLTTKVINVCVSLGFDSLLNNTHTMLTEIFAHSSENNANSDDKGI